MPPSSLEQRVAALEHEVAELKARPANGRVKDWRQTVGRFTDDPGMKEIFAEALKLREADRRKVRRPPSKRSAAS
jgi:hypothetical protein